MSTLSMHKCSLLFAASFLFVLTINTPPAAAQECCEVNADPNTATNPQAGETLGRSVAVDGGTAVAGAPGFDRFIDEVNFPDAGRAIVFTFNAGNQTWEVQDTLFAEFAQEQAFFGHSVAICGDVAVIGACTTGYCIGRKLPTRRPLCSWSPSPSPPSCPCLRTCC